MKTRTTEKGMASIVVVSVLIVLMTIITISFALIMNRATHNSLNNQLATAANYAAESGINDAISYIKANPNATASTCSALASTPPFTNSDLSGNGTTGYSCVLINPSPGDLQYQAIPPNSSQIIKATTTSKVQEFMFSWRLSGGSGSQPASVGGLTDETTWNTNNYTPMLRVTLYPIPNDGSLSSVEANSKTFFFYPTSAGGAVTKFNYTAQADGSIAGINCSAVLNENGFTTDSYDCHAGINGLQSSIPSLNYFYLRITPIYNTADVRVQAKDNGGNSDNFNSQIAIDVIGKSGAAVKRLEARVGIGPGPNDIAFPEYGLRTAMTLCKRLALQGTATPPTAIIDSSFCNLNISQP